ncbi:MAG TPA: hypothetical protein VNC50_22565, partial [Planctomycetia bacterium]|nr:hypothetical protein [Planctomycetia bacterium]
DKNWLVDEINCFLSRRLRNAKVGERAEPDDSRTASDSELESTLAAVGVTVTRPEEGTLRLSRKAMDLPAGGGAIVAAMCAGFAGLWYATLFTFFRFGIESPFPMNVALALFSIPFIVGGLMPLAVAALALRGTSVLDVGPEEIVSRIGVGRFGYTRRLPTAEIDFVGADGDEDNPRWRDRPKNASAKFVVRAGGKSISAWYATSPATCRALAELIRRRLPS